MIRLSRTLIILGEGILLGISLTILNKIPCPFKLLFNIPCPLCGLTRTFYSLVSLNINKIFYYNILFIPILILLIPALL